MRIEPVERRHRGLRLAPLVDVVFLLLVFFMLVSRLEVPQTIHVEPPSKAGGGSLQGAVLIRLDADGHLDLNGLEVNIDRLPGEIAPFLVKEPEPRILVQPAQSAPLQALVKVLDVLKGAGAGHLTLVEP